MSGLDSKGRQAGVPSSLYQRWPLHRDPLTLWQLKENGPSCEFNRLGHIGLHHLAFKVGSEEELRSAFERVAAWPGVIVEFDPEFSGKGPKVHFMINEPGGTRIEFAWDPR